MSEAALRSGVLKRTATCHTNASRQTEGARAPDVAGLSNIAPQTQAHRAACFRSKLDNTSALSHINAMFRCQPARNFSHRGHQMSPVVWLQGSRHLRRTDGCSFGTRVQKFEHRGHNAQILIMHERSREMVVR